MEFIITTIVILSFFAMLMSIFAIIRGSSTMSLPLNRKKGLIILLSSILLVISINKQTPSHMKRATAADVFRQNVPTVSQYHTEKPSEGVEQATISDCKRSATPKQAAPSAPVPPISNLYFQNCSEARSANKTPIYEGQSGYRPALDRDKNGIACE